MLKKIKIICLETNEFPQRGDLVYMPGTVEPWGIMENLNNEDLYIVKVPEGTQYYPKKPIKQHLYFVADEPLALGDWCYNTGNGDESVHKMISNACINLNCSKIVATTNPALWTKEYSISPSLPKEVLPDVAKIGKDVLLDYIKAGGEIEEAMLEYEEGPVPIDGGGYDDGIWVKTRPDGTVITHPVEETKEALIQKTLEIIKEETELSGVRKYTCMNGSGYSPLERTIAERIVSLVLKK